MDPQVTWEAMLTAVGERNWPLAEEKAYGILNWLTNKGVPPVTSSHKNLPKKWHHTVVYMQCYLVIGWPRKKDKKQRGKA